MSEAKLGDQVTPDVAEGAPETIARAAGKVIRETSERPSGSARDGLRQASAASTAGAEAAIRTCSSLAEGVQEVTNAWAHYTEEIMRQTSEVSRALIECRSLTEMFEIQSRLLGSNLRVFLDQSSKIAEIAGWMAARPLEALKQAGEARR